MYSIFCPLKGNFKFPVVQTLPHVRWHSNLFAMISAIQPSHEPRISQYNTCTDNIYQLTTKSGRISEMNVLSNTVEETVVQI